ncbi:MAG: GntR family transcriptional regulator [bacterium]
METHLTRIEKPTLLTDRAYNSIKRAILNGILTSGQALAVSHLGEALGVSRTPIRQAMARLREEGFVRYSPASGYHVSDIKVKEIAEIYELREILECYLVRETATKLSNDELAQMEGAVRRASDALEKRDHIGFLNGNRTFHHMFDRKQGNRHISRVLANLDGHTRRLVSCELADGTDTLVASHREHMLILKAIREGQVESAESLMRKHLRGFCRELMRRRGEA